MYDKQHLEQLDQRLREWDKTAQKTRQRKSLPRFFTVSGVDIDELYTPASVNQADNAEYYWSHIGLPGEFPYTRGVH
ncbi:MAG: methylmalonyl-CoA mutase, partial [Candidatus Zixiibacteriota bacterium]